VTKKIISRLKSRQNDFCLNFLIDRWHGTGGFSNPQFVQLLLVELAITIFVRMQSLVFGQPACNQEIGDGIL
jgi:hypothetical protein